MKRRCICGCGRKKGLHRHHAVTQQRLRQVAAERADNAQDRGLHEAALCADTRNIVLVAFRCHQQHHAAKVKLPLAVLPDSCYEFAAEVLGAGPAYEYLRRYYGGSDPRLDALLEAVDA